MIIPETTEAPSWRECSSYDYMDCLAKRDWSWEGLRRNENLDQDWQAAKPTFEPAEADGPVTIIKCHRSNTMIDRWGLIYSDAPRLDARSARVVWQPDLYSGVLSMTALAADKRGDDKCFCLNAVRCPSLLFLRPGDRQHVVFLGEGRGLQLAVQGASLMNPVRLLIDAAPGARAACLQTGLLKCFNDLSSEGRMKPRYSLRKIAARRLKTVLQALDGAMSGASHREIAIGIYGQERVAADWNDPKENLKDHIRKTIRRGFRLMNGGYRSFLR
jgi:hypothetical protein